VSVFCSQWCGIDSAVMNGCYWRTTTSSAIACDVGFQETAKLIYTSEISAFQTFTINSQRLPQVKSRP
jgi:hypothetical protein